MPKTHVPRRWLAMPATNDCRVIDAFGDPPPSVTAPGNEGMLAMLGNDVEPEVCELVWRCRVNQVLDRDGRSPEPFRDRSERGFDVLIYRQGSYEPWLEGDYAG